MDALIVAAKKEGTLAVASFAAVALGFGMLTLLPAALLIGWAFRDTQPISS
jgi:uncharacterized membrane protein YqjE